MTERPPPGRLLQRLVAGPTLVAHALWCDRIDSTNTEVVRRARDGAAEGLLVLSDEQTAGRGRMGRGWQAPRGTSLMGSLLLRPRAPIAQFALLPLLSGLALAEACESLAPGSQLSLKWPNDLLADGRKCAGILVEVPEPRTAVVGFGVNVDWRGVERPDELSMTASLSEVGCGRVDRWALLQAVVERFDRRYRGWCDDPRAFLPAYRERCATLGADVRVEQVEGEPIIGTAEHITDAGALVVVGAHGTAELHAGTVEHLRHR